MGEPAIRPFAPGDVDACYDICLRTGDNGRDASTLYTDPRLIGEVWVGPYLERWPEHAFVVADETGVDGYIVGAADTIEHQRWLDSEWLPPLQRRYPVDAFPAGTADAELVRLLHDPPRSRDHHAARWPAHLHIDLLPHIQGRGYGRALMRVFLASLRSAGVPRVHLGVSADNAGAIAFYRRLGFEELEDGIIWGRSTDPV